MDELLQYKKAVDIARNGVSIFALINILHYDESWISLLGNYATTIDRELLFLKKIADADKKLPKEQYATVWYKIMALYEHPDLGDKSTKR